MLGNCASDAPFEKAVRPLETAIRFCLNFPGCNNAYVEMMGTLEGCFAGLPYSGRLLKIVLSRQRDLI